MGDLANWLGKPAVFAASAFAAYLIGVLSIAVSSLLNTCLHLVTRGRLRGLFIGSPGVYRTLSEAIINRLSRRFLDDPAFQEPRSHPTSLGPAQRAPGANAGEAP